MRAVLRGVFTSRFVVKGVRAAINQSDIAPIDEPDLIAAYEYKCRPLQAGRPRS